MTDKKTRGRKGAITDIDARYPCLAASVQSGENNHWTLSPFLLVLRLLSPRLTNGVFGPIIIMGVCAAKSLSDSEKALV